MAGSWRDEADLAQRAQTLRQQLQLDALLVTRSEEGMSLFDAHGAEHQPTLAREVFDVSGAGDTVIATLGLALAAGLSRPHAMHLATPPPASWWPSWAPPWWTNRNCLRPDAARNSGAYPRDPRRLALPALLVPTWSGAQPARRH